MTIELTLDNNSDAYDTWSSTYAVEPKTCHHAAVFASGNAAIPFTKNVESMPPNTDTTRKTDQAAENANIKPMGVDTEFRVDIKFGGKEGTKVSTGGSVQVEDKHGNHAKIDVKKDEDGSTTVSASAGHKDKDKGK